MDFLLGSYINISTWNIKTFYSKLGLLTSFVLIPLFVIFGIFIIKGKNKIFKERILEKKIQNFWYFVIDDLKPKLNFYGRYDLEVVIFKDFIISSIIVLAVKIPIIVILTILTVLMTSGIWTFVYKPSKNNFENFTNIINDIFFSLILLIFLFLEIFQNLAENFRENYLGNLLVFLLIIVIVFNMVTTVWLLYGFASKKCQNGENRKQLKQFIFGLGKSKDSIYNRSVTKVTNKKHEGDQTTRNLNKKIPNEKKFSKKNLQKNNFSKAIFPVKIEVKKVKKGKKNYAKSPRMRKISAGIGKEELKFSLKKFGVKKRTLLPQSNSPGDKKEKGKFEKKCIEKIVGISSPKKRKKMRNFSTHLMGTGLEEN